jgi:hypothetical protein
MRAVAEENTKNYQLWNHRRRCALAEGAATAERVRRLPCAFKCCLPARSPPALPDHDKRLPLLPLHSFAHPVPARRPARRNWPSATAP